MTSTTNDTSPIYSSLASDPDLQELVEMFVEEMPDRISAVQTAYDSGDLESLQRIAHQMKGSAGSYGFDQLTPLAAELEFTLSESDPTEKVLAAVEQLVRACQRVTAATA